MGADRERLVRKAFVVELGPAFLQQIADVLQLQNVAEQREFHGLALARLYLDRPGEVLDEGFFVVAAGLEARHEIVATRYQDALAREALRCLLHAEILRRDLRGCRDAL